MSGWDKVDAEVALEIAHHEAVVREAYKDSVNKWTWSVGLTSATGHKVERYIKNPQPLEHCLRIYAWALDRYADDVRRVFRGYPLTKEQFTAALSFHWNTGGIRKASWVPLFKQGRMEEAEKAFLSWKKPPELLPRRRLEADLLFRGEWSNDGTMTEYKVSAKGYPIWRSGKKVRVDGILNDIFATPKVIPLDHASDPSAPVEVPTLSPEGIDPIAGPSYNSRPWWKRLWAFLVNLAKE